MRTSWRIARALLLVGGLLLLGQAATGFVPDAERVTRAVAGANKASGRSQALRLDLDMRIGDGDVIAKGELVTHPTGLARLELRAPEGLVERHVLQGNLHEASRNGIRLEQHRAFLPPLFLLQAASQVTLAAALDGFGVRSDMIGLAPCGESSCYVIGDPGRVVPEKVAEPELQEGAGLKAGVLGPGPVLGSFATIWVDIENFDLLRIESRAGVRTTLGPVIPSDGIRAPSWILIEEPEQSVVRFEVTKVTPVNAPAVAFGESWLLAPVGASPAPSPSPGLPGDSAAPVNPEKS